MSDPVAIRPEPAGPLTARQECAVLRAALQRDPGAAGLRLRLARLLVQLDAFDEAIALAGTAGSALGCAEQLLLAAAYLARKAPGDVEHARIATERAFELAETDVERAAALSDQAKTMDRLDRTDAARDLLARALRLDPHNREACKRLSMSLLRDGRCEEVLALTDDLAARGVHHTRLQTARTLALAQRGEIEAARARINLPHFLYERVMNPPAGWSSLAEFNDALAAELLAHPDMRFGRYGTASKQTWRIDAPAAGTAPAVRALLDAIADTIAQHLETLAASDHPWLVARPERATLRSWCVITEGDGYEEWHAHPAGWLSGGYYVQVPPGMAHGDGNAGCIAFGLPDGVIGTGAAHQFGETLIRPQPGSLTLFPSHAFHRTYPHSAQGRRICVAFDILPE